MPSLYLLLTIIIAETFYLHLIYTALIFEEEKPYRSNPICSSYPKYVLFPLPLDVTNGSFLINNYLSINPSKSHYLICTLPFHYNELVRINLLFLYI